MNDLTLLIMAAGMGSRYGGLKQLDSVGPNGETIIDYSVYDAIRAGFNKVVFVIRKEFYKEFKSRILTRGFRCWCQPRRLNETTNRQLRCHI